MDTRVGLDPKVSTLSQKLRNYFTLFFLTNIGNMLQTQQPSTRMLLSELVPFLYASPLMSTPLFKLPFPQGDFRPQVKLKLPSARLPVTGQ